VRTVCAHFKTNQPIKEKTMNLVQKLKDLEAATKNAQAMTGTAIVQAIHTLAEGVNALIEIQGIEELIDADPVASEAV
jgi:hypothetical protein